MKPAPLIGIILIIVGVLIMAYQGFTYTKRERVLDVGPLKVDADKKETVPISPVIGGLCLVGGIVLVVAGNRK